MVSNWDVLWVIICACFVFFMQAGFICYEVGFVKSKNVISVAIENLLTFTITTICFCLVGFPLMFGESWHGLLGTSFWGFSGIGDTSPLGFAFVFFELMFAATAVTIFAGSMSERTRLFPLQIAAVISAAVIFPVYGHWVWGGLFVEQDTWLASMGYIDFAGATVVHTTAGFIALAGLIVVGKRSNPHMGRSNIPFAVLGVFILWFAWFGFNGGSLLEFNEHVGLVLFNTNLAAAAGMLGALVMNRILSRKGGYLVSIFNGVLGGLVAITAASYYMEPVSALLLGLLAGMIVDWSSHLMVKLGIDDAVGAVPVHLFGGIAGTLLLPFLMSGELLHTGSRMSQFLVQLLGLSVNGVWAFGTAFVMFKLIDKAIGLRVTPEEEEKGLNIVEFSDIYSWEKYMEISGYEREINDKNELLRKQARLLAVTEEQEKSKLARDLHDGVGQSLAALKLLLGMSKKNAQSGHQGGSPGSPLEQTETALRLTEESIAEIRNVLNNLKPEALEKDGLAGGLNAMAESLNQTGEFVCSLVLASPVPSFDETVSLNLYRVVQEAVTNAVKHASAKRITIEAREDTKTGRYRIAIRDDGKGFVLPEEETGFGIPSMSDRMKMLGGTFRIDSAPGAGTVIYLEVPYAEE